MITPTAKPTPEIQVGPLHEIANHPGSRLSLKDWLAIYCITLIITVGAFLVVFLTVWLAMGQTAAVAMLTWCGTIISYAVYVVPIFVGIYLLLRMTRVHDVQIVNSVANAITRHDAVDAIGDTLRTQSAAAPVALSGNDLTRLAEAQNALHRTFLEQVGSTARIISAESTRMKPSPYTAGFGAMFNGDGAGNTNHAEAQEEW